MSARSWIAALSLALSLLACRGKSRAPGAAGAAAEAGRSGTAAVELVLALPGLSSFEVEQQLTVPAEAALSSLPGLAHLASVSRPGHALIRLEPGAGADLAQMRSDARDRLQPAITTQMPEGVTLGIASDLDSPASALHVAVLADSAAPTVPGAVLRPIRAAALTAYGVGDAFVCGARPPLVEVVADPARLTALRLTSNDLVHVLADRFRPRELVIGRPPPAASLDGIAEIAIPGQRAAVRDVAELRLGLEETGCGAAAPGKVTAALITARLHRGADPVAVRAALAQKLAAAVTTLPSGSARLLQPSALRVELVAPGAGSPTEAAAKLGAAVQAALDAAPELRGWPWILRLGDAAVDPAPHAPIDGELFLEPPAAGASAAELAALTRALGTVPGLWIGRIAAPPPSAAEAAPSIAVLRIEGDDLEALARVAGEAQAVAARAPGVLGALARSQRAPEVQVHIDRAAAAQRGLSAHDVASTLRAAIAGLPMGSVSINGEEARVRVLLGDHRRGDPGAATQLIAGLPVRGAGSTAGAAATLGEVTKISLAEQHAEIRRRDRRRYVAVEVRLAPPAEPALEAARKAIETDLRLPPGLTVVWEGSAP